MNYDKNSFLAGVAVGMRLKGWGIGEGTAPPPGPEPIEGVLIAEVSGRSVSFTVKGNVQIDWGDGNQETVWAGDIYTLTCLRCGTNLGEQGNDQFAPVDECPGCDISSPPTEVDHVGTPRDVVVSHNYPNDGPYTIKVGGNPLDISFDGCHALTRILTPFPESMGPHGGVYRTFTDCVNLVSVPADLFKWTRGAPDLLWTFCNCTSLESIPTLFDGIIAGDGVFDYAFYNCTNMTGAAPPLWSWYPNSRGIQCFRGCTSLSNYGEIPAGWK